jgi:hypothetical protein
MVVALHKCRPYSSAYVRRIYSQCRQKNLDLSLACLVTFVRGEHAWPLHAHGNLNRLAMSRSVVHDVHDVMSHACVHGSREVAWTND